MRLLKKLKRPLSVYAHGVLNAQMIERKRLTSAHGDQIHFSGTKSAVSVVKVIMRSACCSCQIRWSSKRAVAAAMLVE
jgi:hypothetical protein